ncbi:interferon-induced very large GTPase 1-like [Antedon mediterranea]|uniref:interferon-induced very large GTPase 1-like n=1 Tax=Antedon mediterranea TaxID=105859 RepID=UPI003AF4D081
MDNKLRKYRRVVEKLGLSKYYPRNLTRKQVFVVSENVISPEELNGHPDKIPWYILQNIVTCNYEGRSFELEESSSSQEKSFSLTSVLGKETDTNDGQVNPIDSLVAIFLCCDDFLRQILIEKLSICQLAIPLLMPVTDVPNKEWELIVWGMRTITKKWQTSSGSSCERSVVTEKLPIVSALRLGRPKISKSKVVNCVINEQKHNIFFHSECKGGNLKRKLSDGLLEIAWYLPSQKSTCTFADALTFINLRGNASNFESQTSFLSKISLVTIAFVSCSDFNEHHTTLLESLYTQEGHVIFILDGSPNEALRDAFCKMDTENRDMKKQVQYITSENKNELKLSGQIWQILGSNCEKGTVGLRHSIEMCIEIAEKMNYHADEIEQNCFEAKQSAEKLLQQVKRAGKQEELPLQEITVDIGEAKKEQHRLLRKESHMQIVAYVNKQKEEVLELRRKQLAKHKNRRMGCTYEMFRSSFTNTLLKRKYFFGFVKVLTDKYCIDTLHPIRREYIRRWNDLCENPQQEKSVSSKAKLDELEQKLSRDSLGLEHFNREIGQHYEMSLDLKQLQAAGNSRLPEVAAEMLLHGYPIELMDGDASHVPLTWVEAVFESLKCQIGKDKKMFVLSVLGIQSSGKSTMLNAMFGLQFAVSAGRCTKGIFAQLVPLDTDLKAKCDYILVVDTEGLRSPESASIEHTNNRDNELATLVIGLGDLTIINIMGENPTDMQDTLQIAVHAFMKMGNVNIKPSCLFVHQNVTDVTASELNTTQKRSMREMLDKITEIAAHAENCSERYKSFSDVITFQEHKHIMYISSLWQGDPPMAPPNPGYSKCILQVKKQIVEIMKNSEPKSIPNFITLLSDLWKAILCQDFVFSFRNSLDIQAFNALNAEHVKHARTLRRNALKYSESLQIKCKEFSVENVNEKGEKCLGDYLQKLEKDISDVQSSMETYFKENKKAIQWKKKVEIQLSDVCSEIKKDMRGTFKSIVIKTTGRAKIEANIKTYEQEIYEKAKTLADEYRHLKLPDEQLESEFAKNWNEWVTKVPIGDDYEDIRTSFQIITEDYQIENHKLEVKRVWQSDLSRTEVQENDLDFSWFENVKLVFRFKGKKAYAYKANYARQQILEDLKTVISNHRQSGTKYNKQLGFELFSKLSSGLENMKIDEKVTINKNSIIPLAVCNFYAVLIPSLEDMQEQHKRENDPRLYMESQKERLWHMFKEECKDLQIVVKVASAISRELTYSIKTSLPAKCKFEVIDHLRHSTAKGFSSKRSLHAMMLIEKADMGFQSLLPCLFQPILCITKFSFTKIHNMCLQKNDETGISLLEQKYRDKVSEIVTGLKQDITTLRTESKVVSKKDKEGDTAMTTMKLWWPALLEHTDEELGLKTDIRLFDEERDLKLHELIDTLMVELKGIEDTVIKAFDSSIFSEIIKSCCQLFLADLLNCQEVCPFCHALCDLNGKHDHHRTDCHIPMGVTGGRWAHTEKLLTDMCTTAVMCNYSFKSKITNNEYINFRNYKSVNTRCASWKIEPLADESEKFWKWFLATYNTELAKFYGTKLTDIPEGWKNITLEEAKEDMKKLYDI